MNEENKLFIKTFKTGLTVDKDGVRSHYSHGHRVRMGGTWTFEYLTDENIAAHSEAARAQVSFCGHFHRTQVIEMNGSSAATVREIEKDTVIALLPNIVYGFNIGMLARNKQQPKLLHFAVLDTVTKEVRLFVE